MNSERKKSDVTHLWTHLNIITCFNYKLEVGEELVTSWSVKRVCLFVWFGVYVAFNNLSVISRRSQKSKVRHKPITKGLGLSLHLVYDPVYHHAIKKERQVVSLNLDHHWICSTSSNIFLISYPLITSWEKNIAYKNNVLLFQKFPPFFKWANFVTYNLLVSA